jgi:putative hydrolase of the HAD superfamily
MSRAIFFDVDGVLIHGYHANPALTRRWDENLLEDLGIDPKRFSSEFIYGPFLKEVLPGHRSLIEVLDEVLPNLGYKGSALTLLDYWMRKDSNVDAATFEIARKLSRHADVSLYMATNQEHTRAMWIWLQLGFGQVFDDMFYAARMGVVKPETAFFDRIMAVIGPQETPPLLFDDSPKVIDAASAYGWEAVLFETAEDCRGHSFIAELLS